MESSEYKHVILGLIVLKFGSDKLEKRRQALIDEGKKVSGDGFIIMTPAGNRIKSIV